MTNFSEIHHTPRWQVHNNLNLTTRLITITIKLIVLRGLLILNAYL